MADDFDLLETDSASKQEKVDVNWGKAVDQMKYKLAQEDDPNVRQKILNATLDDVVGIDGWENAYKEAAGGKGYLCGLSIRFGDKWITKWDGSEYSQIESLKGALSGAMKRTAVQFGIGRYLYSLDTEFATCAPVESRFVANGEFINIPLNKSNKNGPRMSAEWFPPELPDWALPKAKFDKYLDAIEQATSLLTLREHYEQAYKFAAVVNRMDIRDKAIEIKDRKKLEIEAKEQENSLNENKKFHTWLNQSIKDRIATAENESVLNLNHKHLLQELKGHCRATKVDSSNFVAQVNQAHTEALNNLRNGV